MKIAQIENPKLAIVGMDSCLGSCNGLEALERIIYDGTQHFITVPPQRWQGMEVQEQFKDYSFENGKAPLGAYIKDFEINLQDLKLSSSAADKLDPQSLLMLKVADNALRDAGLEPGKKVAVILATATELSVQQLQHKWNFIGPSFTFNTAENSAFKVLEVAQKLLVTWEVDAVLVGAVDLASEPESILARQIATVNTGVNTLSYDRKANGWMIGEGAIALVLKLHETAKQATDRIYAVIDAITRLPKHSTAAEAVTQACQQAFHLAGIKPKDIGYLEVCGSGIPQEDESEIEGLIQAYQLPPTLLHKGNVIGGGISGEAANQQNDLTCAIGSVKTNLGHTHAASDIASLVKTALCLYHRYIPATLQWSGPKMPEIWQGSPFYVATESRPWFLETGSDRRAAAINSMGVDGTYAHLILSEEPSQTNRSSKYLEQMPFYLFAIAADDCSSLLEQLSALQQTIEDCSSLSAAASLTFTALQQRSQATYALAILGHNKDELKREIQRAVKGVANAFDQGEWQTPVGSYFTAKPLGKKGKIAFVYPGAYNSYVGLARNLFHLFPRIYDDLVIKSVYSRVANIEKLLYPRSLNSLSKRQLESLEKQLLDNPLAMLESETGFAGLITAILKDYFKVKPQSAFGYSLGETSMMFSQGVWTSFNQLSDALNSSQLFSTRLSGAKNAVREYWGLSQQNYEANFWSTYVLMASASQVKECLKHEKRVYLTQINTHKELIIAGDTQACMRVIESLKCDAFRAPFNHVIHCEAISSEYDELFRLNTLPTQNVADITFYSAADYEPITVDSQAIAHNLAKVLCQQLDFPELVNRVHKDDTKIFIETGVGSNCSRWIDEILNQKEHVTISLNRRGIDDHTSIVKALAKLLSHRVNLDLSPLYSQVRDAIQSNSTFKNITLTGNSIPSKTASDINKEDMSSIMLQVALENQQHKLESSENGVKSSFILDDTQENAGKNVVEEKHKPIPSNSITTQKLIQQAEKINLLNPQYQKLNENNSRATKIHAAFLQARQDSLQQISEIIQTQTVVCQQVLYQQYLSEIKK